MLTFDHFAVAALSLEAGVAYVEEELGVRVPAGGAHSFMGTHNHVMRLGENVYLEIIAPDPNVTPKRPRWFALDDPTMRASLATRPRIASWAVRTEDIEHALQQIPGVKGDPLYMTRGAFSWVIAVPPDGSVTHDGAFPSIMQWLGGQHPVGRMADLGCRLNSFEIAHPEAETVKNALSLDDPRIVYRVAPGLSLSANLDTPKGSRTLR